MSLLNEEKAQVSIEYLLMSVFSILLAITAALIVQTMQDVSDQAIKEISNIRSTVIENILVN
ncbi:MAG: hypothetical protein PHQ98_00340 [Candidatus ainarchaeum sp.]|nr:hypothetical protein [Candidatus ainarchaeum sp.]